MIDLLIPLSFQIIVESDRELPCGQELPQYRVVVQDSPIRFPVVSAVYSPATLSVTVYPHLNKRVFCEGFEDDS